MKAPFRQAALSPETQLFYFKVAGRVYPAQTIGELVQNMDFLNTYNGYWADQFKSIQACPVGSTVWAPYHSLAGALEFKYEPATHSFKLVKGESPAVQSLPVPSSPVADVAAPVDGIRILLWLFLCAGIIGIIVALSMDTDRTVAGSSIINLPSAHLQSNIIVMSCFAAAVGFLGLITYRPKTAV